MFELHTQHLRIREILPEDATFILRLLNDPDFVRYIGDRNVRNLEDARRYINDGPRAMYRAHGMGLWLVLKDSTPIGTCGLLRREGLENPDLGFAFLPEYRGRGYAVEASVAVLEHGHQNLALNRIDAIAQPDNTRSMALLGKLGFKALGEITLPGEDTAIALLAKTLG